MKQSHKKSRSGTSCKGLFTTCIFLHLKQKHQERENSYFTYKLISFSVYEGSVGSNSSLPRKNSPPARLKLKSPAKRNEPVSQKGSEGASRALEGPSGHLPRGSDPRDSAPRPRELGGVMGGGRAEPRLLGGGRAEPRLQDSVENSFREKLTVQVNNYFN